MPLRAPIATSAALLAAFAGCAQPAPLTARCSLTDNPLRATCTADTTGPVTWALEAPDGATRTFTSDAPILAWGLPPRTEQVWTATDSDGREATGTLRTGALPSALDALHLTASGTLSGADAVLFPFEAEKTWWMVMVDGEGRVVWYEPVDTGGEAGEHAITGYSWTENGTLLLSIAGITAREIDPAGATLWEATGFDRRIHHDLYRAGPYVYILNDAVHDGYTMDGFYVLDADGILASWDLADIVTPVHDAPPSTEPIDWSHGNAIWSDGDSAMVSLRWLSSAVVVRGDPMAQDFGAVDGILEGQESQLPGETTWPKGEGFDEQHHATPVPGSAGRTSVFDNGPSARPDSRALQVTWDPATGTAAEVAEWRFEKSCTIEGSNYPMPDGQMLATCATWGQVREVRPGVEAPDWSLDVDDGRAPNGAVVILPRATPVSWPAN